MDNARKRRFLPSLMGPAGLLLMWLWFGPKFVAMWMLGFFVFFVGPLWLAAVLGKPYAQRPR